MYSCRVVVLWTFILGHTCESFYCVMMQLLLFLRIRSFRHVLLLMLTKLHPFLSQPFFFFCFLLTHLIIHSVRGRLHAVHIKKGLDANVAGAQFSHWLHSPKKTELSSELSFIYSNQILSSSSHVSLFLCVFMHFSLFVASDKWRSRSDAGAGLRLGGPVGCSRWWGQ